MYIFIAQFSEQYDQYFPSFSYFADLFHEPFDGWNNSKIWETRNIGYIVKGKPAITNWSHAKYLLFANSSFIKGSKKTQKNKVVILIINRWLITN